MMAPIRFLIWILGIAFTLGLAEGFDHITYQMATAALHAQSDQLSYGKVSRLLWQQSGHRNHPKDKTR